MEIAPCYLCDLVHVMHELMDIDSHLIDGLLIDVLIDVDEFYGRHTHGTTNSMTWAGELHTDKRGGLCAESSFAAL